MLFAFAGCAPAIAAAAALADQTWVAGEGFDTGACDSTQPCATLAYAQTQTASGGTISVMDSANYGEVTITKSLTIRGDIGTPALITSIRILAGVADRVLILGVDLEGTAGGKSYVNGIKIEGAAEVLIQNCRIKGYTGSTTDGAGIYIATGTATRVTVDGSTLFYNTMGIMVSSTVFGAGHLKLYRSLLLGNGASGVRVQGNGNDALLVGTIILGSAKALDIKPGGNIKSYGDNVLTSGDTPVVLPKN